MRNTFFVHSNCEHVEHLTFNFFLVLHFSHRKQNGRKNMFGYFACNLQRGFMFVETCSARICKDANMKCHWSQLTTRIPYKGITRGARVYTTSWLVYFHMCQYFCLSITFCILFIVFFTVAMNNLVGNSQKIILLSVIYSHRI